MENAKLKELAQDMDRQTVAFNKRLEQLSSTRDKLRTTQEKALSRSLKNARRPTPENNEALQEVLSTLDDQKDALISQQLETLQDSLNLLKLKDSFINQIAELTKKANEQAAVQEDLPASEQKVQELE
jgi:hypothetical protein